MTPLAAKIVAKMAAYACKEALGSEREPQSEEEATLIADQFRRLQEHSKLFRYASKPFPKQQWFHRANAKITAYIGSNQSSKTFSLLADALSWCLGEYLWSGKQVLDLYGRPVVPPIRCMLASKDFINAGAEVIMPKLKELLPLEALGVTFERMQGRVTHKLHFPADLGGSSIKFQAYTQDPDNFEGTTWHWIGFDEPMPRFALIGASRGAMRHGAPIKMAMTPLKEPYLYDEVYMHPDAVHIGCEEDLARVTRKSIAIINVDIADTPFVTDEEKQRFADGLNDEEKEARLHGKFFHLQGKVYPGFDRTKHVIDTIQFMQRSPEWREWPAFIVVDPHDRRPWATAWGVISPRSEIFFVDEWPNFNFIKTKRWQNSIETYLDIYRGKEAELKLQNLYWRIIDPRFGNTAKAGTGRTLIELFADHGFYFEGPPSDEVEAGHALVREALKSETMFWLDRCTNFIKAMDSYTWDEFRPGEDRPVKEKPKEQYKDFPDLARYTLMLPVCYYDRVASASLMYPRGYQNGGMGKR